MEIQEIIISNKSDMKVRAEVRYNESSETLTLVVYDRVGSVYIDANPGKDVTVEAHWIQREGGEEGEENGSDTGQTGNIPKAD